MVIDFIVFFLFDLQWEHWWCREVKDALLLVATNNKDLNRGIEAYRYDLCNLVLNVFLSILNSQRDIRNSYIKYHYMYGLGWLVQKLFVKFFPPGRTRKLGSEITLFAQSDSESFIYTRHEKGMMDFWRCIHIMRKHHGCKFRPSTISGRPRISSELGDPYCWPLIINKISIIIHMKALFFSRIYVKYSIYSLYSLQLPIF